MKTRKTFTAFNGVTWTEEQTAEYERLQDRKNAFIKAGRKVPEELLNSSHKLFCLFSGLI